METVIFKVKNNSLEKEDLDNICEIIKSSGVVAFPTETVYGLGANALDVEAVKGIFKAKGRPSDNPLIVHISNLEMLDELVEEVGDAAKKLMDAFWPGPITFILKKKKEVSETVTAGLQTIAIRFPSDKIARDIIEYCGKPIAAPSANLSGKPSPTNGEHVIRDLTGRVEAIVVGEDAVIGLESTVVDLTGKYPMILRPGGISKEELEKVIGQVQIDKALNSEYSEDNKPKSPGMKYTHYAPKAEARLATGTREEQVIKIKELLNDLRSSGHSVGVLTVDENVEKYACDNIISLGSINNMDEIASNLFKALREFDDTSVEYILCESFENVGIGLAIMNRLKKACGYRKF